jgi:tRNA A37 threonylcarbamoyladenosine dehydratase
MFGPSAANSMAQSRQVDPKRINIADHKTPVVSNMANLDKSTNPLSLL